VNAIGFQIKLKVIHGSFAAVVAFGLLWILGIVCQALRKSPEI
jgi:hypothetical protein